MTTHTNCTHPKTKAARAACRSGKPQPDGSPARSAAERLADQAASTSARMSKPKHGWGDAPTNPLAGRGPYSKIYRSGHCDVGQHDRCSGQYSQSTCSCSCHDDSLS